MEHEARIEKIVGRLEGEGIDALWVTDLSNVRYLTGFSGSAGQVLIGSRTANFFSDGRYAQRAKATVSGAEIGIYDQRPTELLGPRLKELGVTRLGVEAREMTLATAADLRKRIEGVELVHTSGLVQDLRRVKDDREIELIERAVAVADGAFEHIVGRLEPGRTEQEVALDLEMWMRANGAEDISFPPIVGSGPLSAHIHHSPSQRSLEKGDLVLMDFGAKVDGYCSDITRTVVLGSATDDQLQHYGLVLEAQAAALAEMRSGASGSDVDAAARRVIAEAGHAELFGHGLGHGVGLDIHEDPRLAKSSDDVLRAGEVITVEPGVYFPEVGGIRIEDDILVTDHGCRGLNAAPKDRLLEL